VAIQREQARRQRPRWMIAVTGAAIAAVIGLGWAALGAMRDAEAAHAARDHALAATATAHQDAEAAHAVADQLARDNQALSERLGSAIQRAEDRQAAREAADASARKRDEQRRAFEAQAAATARAQEQLRQERRKPITISDDCLKNAICTK
ncbi:MAG TPA: hypothetical protein VFP84_25450, partial [Kofleriaceae bacterium]|nr:hypothetical protein [Kofleriaceae bacterium]